MNSFLLRTLSAALFLAPIAAAQNVIPLYPGPTPISPKLSPKSRVFPQPVKAFSLLL